MPTLRLVLVLGPWLSVLGSSAAEVQSPLSPADAQKSFQLADASLRIELAAAEPDVIDPVAIRFDEDGRMWMAQMRDYPLGPSDGGEPLSQIRVLEDRDGDGRFETATTFADKLPFVTGLQPWKGGVFVTLAGRVAYMKDTSGDGRSDLDETWFEGFAQQNSQLRANHPRLALDNHIYVANGLRGGKVVNKRLTDQPAIDISGMDFRFDPLTGRAEAVSGNGQFGLCFDDWGNRFTCTNRNPCRHVVIEDRYLRASPGVTVPTVMHDVAAFAESSRIFPISRAWTTSNLHAGTFTAACGVYFYRGDLLPAEFKGNVFTCDPTGNLIHREIMQPAGPTFTSKPAYEGKEFLASPDEWFRPVNMELGPDGALYVVDMYRCVIEHPDFVPDELKRRPDLRLGDDRGRIWRIVPADTNPKRKRGSPLSTATAADLVKLLDHQSAWQRETAQRLFIEREFAPPIEDLQKLIGAKGSPQGKIHAMAVLESYGRAPPELEDQDPHVQRIAILIRETRGGEIKPGGDDPQVRFQSRLSASRLGSEEFAAESIRELVQDAHDPWQRCAIRMHWGPLGAGIAVDSLLRLFQEVGTTPLSKTQMDWATLTAELCELAASSGHPQARLRPIPGIETLKSNPQLGLMVLHGVVRGLARRRVSLAEAVEGDAIDALRQQLTALINDAKLDLEIRRSAVELAGHLPNSADLLTPLLSGKETRDLRVATIGALARQPGTVHWQPLVDGLPSDTPAARRAILDGVLANTERSKLLLDALEAGRIKLSELDPLQARRLTESRDDAVKERASKLFAAATPEERVKALADYQPALTLAADAKRGIAIFEKNCAACHKIGDVGVNVAPDISDSRTKTAEQLLGDILQPNRAIDNNYLGYSVRLADGTTATGILTTETATSITLRQQGGKDLVLARGEIDELKSSGVSLMPEGLERQIPLQDMADLIAFIKNWRYLDGKTPLGQ
jgi:putative membrane-bound dehydrogenase-like protein